MSKKVYCPSAPCSEGNLLVGVVDADGSIDYLPSALKLDENLARIALRGRSPTRRFRFAGPCTTRKCANWSDGTCGVARTIMDYATAKELEPTLRMRDLPDCSIRDRCRWYKQHGEKICFSCRWLITERNYGGDS